MTSEEITAELEDIALWANGLKQQATSLIKKLGQIPAPAIKRGLSSDQKLKLKSNRLKSILKKQQSKGCSTKELC